MIEDAGYHLPSFWRSSISYDDVRGVSVGADLTVEKAYRSVRDTTSDYAYTRTGANSGSTTTRPTYGDLHSSAAASGLSTAFGSILP